MLGREDCDPVDVNALDLLDPAGEALEFREDEKTGKREAQCSSHEPLVCNQFTWSKQSIFKWRLSQSLSESPRACESGLRGLMQRNCSYCQFLYVDAKEVKFCSAVCSAMFNGDVDLFVFFDPDAPSTLRETPLPW